MNDAIVQLMGFKDIREFFAMTSRVRIDTPERVKRFKDWRENDGTKSGLEEVTRQNKSELYCPHCGGGIREAERSELEYGLYSGAFVCDNCRYSTDCPPDKADED